MIWFDCAVVPEILPVVPGAMQGKGAEIAGISGKERLREREGNIGHAPR